MHSGGMFRIIKVVGAPPSRDAGPCSACRAHDALLPRSTSEIARTHMLSTIAPPLKLPCREGGGASAVHSSTPQAAPKRRRGCRTRPRRQRGLMPESQKPAPKRCGVLRWTIRSASVARRRLGQPKRACRQLRWGRADWTLPHDVPKISTGARHNAASSQATRTVRRLNAVRLHETAARAPLRAGGAEPGGEATSHP